MTGAKALFISDEKFLSVNVNGGVQICTQEYIRYISLAGYDIKTFPVKPKISLLKRVKIKLGVDGYDHYAIDGYLHQLLQVIQTSAANVVFFNQLSLAMWAPILKQHISEDIKLIALSHGNESADYFHEITRNGPASKLQTWKLGNLLVKEAQLFSSALDGIIVMNENEAAINTWLGADRILYLPRQLTPYFLNWTPAKQTAGFVGTLDHLPNRLGLQMLANELKIKKYNGKLVLIGGPPEIGQVFSRQYDFIEYLGQVSDDQLANEISKWSLFLNPVFWFARGASTKLALAINWGVPCLTTAAGRRGYVLADESIVTAGNDASIFADQVIKALKDPVYLQGLKTATEANASSFNLPDWVERLKAFLK